LLATRDGTPVLAFGHRGLGRIAAFAADWTGDWSAAWRADPAFPARLAAWVSATRPAPAAATDADRLQGPRRLSPAAPTRPERVRLATLPGDRRLAPIDELGPPPPRSVERVRGRAAEL